MGDFGSDSSSSVSHQEQTASGQARNVRGNSNVNNKGTYFGPNSKLNTGIALTGSSSLNTGVSVKNSGKGSVTIGDGGAASAAISQNFTDTINKLIGGNSDVAQTNAAGGFLQTLLDKATGQSQAQPVIVSAPASPDIGSQVTDALSRAGLTTPDPNSSSGAERSNRLWLWGLGLAAILALLFFGRKLKFA